MPKAMPALLSLFLACGLGAAAQAGGGERAYFFSPAFSLLDPGPAVVRSLRGLYMGGLSSDIGFPRDLGMALMQQRPDAVARRAMLGPLFMQLPLQRRRQLLRLLASRAALSQQERLRIAAELSAALSAAAPLVDREVGRALAGFAGSRDLSALSLDALKDREARLFSMIKVVRALRFYCGRRRDVGLRRLESEEERARGELMHRLVAAGAASMSPKGPTVTAESRFSPSSYYLLELGRSWDELNRLARRARRLFEASPYLQSLGLRGVLPRLDLSNPATPRRVLALQIDPDRFEKRSQHDIFRGERASNEELKAAAKDLLRRDLRFTGVSIVVEPQERPRPPQVLLNLSASLDPVWVYELDFNYRMIDPELRGPIDSALKQPQPKLDSLIRGKLGSGSPGRVVLQVVWAGALPNGAARYAVRAVISSRPLARLTLIVSSSGRLEVSERGR